MLIGSTFVDFTAGSKVFERSSICIEPEQAFCFPQQYSITAIDISVVLHVRLSRCGLKYERKWTQVTCKSHPILYR